MMISRPLHHAKAYLWLLCVLLALIAASCKTSATGGILGPVDETQEAALLVASANEDLSKIKLIYEDNEKKRAELKAAMEKNDITAAKKLADDVVYIINAAAISGSDAVEKIQKAQDMKINDDYREYLRLKEESLKLELQAFEEYRQAARTLREKTSSAAI